MRVPPVGVGPPATVPALPTPCLHLPDLRNAALVLLAPEEGLVGVAAAVLAARSMAGVQVIRQPRSCAAGCRRRSPAQPRCGRRPASEAACAAAQRPA